MLDTPLVRRALWVLTAGCLCGALVAVPLVGDGNGGGSVKADTAGAGAQPSDNASSPTEGAGSTPEPEAGAGGLDVPLSPGSPLASPTTEAPAEDLGRPGDPGPTVPPRPGTYRYRYRQGGQESISFTVVEDRGRVGEETRQVISRKGGGLETTSDLSWRPDGAYVLKTVFALGGGSRDCDWNPDVLRSRLPLAIGVAWEARSSCTFEGIGPSPLVLSYQSTGRVTAVQRVRVAGEVLAVWAIEETEHFDFGGRTVDNTTTTLASPRHGVIVKSSTRTRDSGAGEATYELELLNLVPE